jgi:hypothetical protein
MSLLAWSKGPSASTQAVPPVQVRDTCSFHSPELRGRRKTSKVAAARAPVLPDSTMKRVQGAPHTLGLTVALALSWPLVQHLCPYLLPSPTKVLAGPDS